MLVESKQTGVSIVRKPIFRRVVRADEYIQSHRLPWGARAPFVGLSNQSRGALGRLLWDSLFKADNFAYALKSMQPPARATVPSKLGMVFSILTAA